MQHRPTVPTPPDAWLVVKEYWNESGRVGYPMVHGVFPSPDDPALLALVKESKDDNRPVRVVLDHPSLEVCHYGLGIQNPSWLSARDIWFQRYRSILEPHLRDPRTAQVYTYAPGRLSDPFATHKSSREGPFPFPRGAAWPTCGFCAHRLGFLGVLDFRDFSAVPMPRGSLVVHVCTECGVGADREAWALTWMREGEAIEMKGDPQPQVLVGTRWDATEYPTPAIYAEELATDGPFLAEDAIFFNFCCFGDKRGGHVFWIHPEDRLYDETSFVSDSGEALTYIGQLASSPDIDIEDCGLAYLLYSPRTGETVMYPQGF